MKIITKCITQLKSEYLGTMPHSKALFIYSTVNLPHFELTWLSLVWLPYFSFAAVFFTFTCHSDHITCDSSQINVLYFSIQTNVSNIYFLHLHIIL